MIKLSDAVQNLPRQVTCNVHGVGGGFIDIGRAKAKAPEPRFTKVSTEQCMFSRSMLVHHAHRLRSHVALSPSTAYMAELPAPPCQLQPAFSSGLQLIGCSSRAGCLLYRQGCVVSDVHASLFGVGCCCGM